MTSEIPSIFGNIRRPSLCNDSFEHNEVEFQVKKQREINFVAGLLASDGARSDSLMRHSCLHDPEIWASQKMYHLYMFLMFFTSEGDKSGFWKIMIKIGKWYNGDGDSP